MFKHSYTAITANFELEPVIEDYIKKYPNNEYTNCHIVFKTLDEHAEGQFSYLIVLVRDSTPKNKQVRFSEFLKSHCVCNDLVATMQSSHILPRLEDRHSGQTFGQLKKA